MCSSATTRRRRIRGDAGRQERREDQDEEAAQHERERNRVERPRGQLPEQRQHHHRRPVGAEDRSGNAQVSQLRQEIAQRNQRETSDQVVVAVFPKMQSDSDIADYTQRVAQAGA